MVRLIILALILFMFANIVVAKEIKLSPEVEKNLGIKVTKVKREFISETVEFPGVAVEDPKNSYIVSSVVEGVLEKIFVKKGDFVRKGQVIASVLSPEINQLRSQIEIAKVKVENALKILERDQMLYHEEVIPFSRYYSSKVEYENAVANLQALEKTLSSYGTIKDNKLLITAKEAGVVLEVFLLAGSPVGIGKEIAKISDISNILVVAQVPPEKVEMVKVGMTVTVKTSTGKELTGKVNLVDYQLDPSTRRNNIHITVRNTSYLIKPNMFVSVVFFQGQESGLTVPITAVIQAKGRNYVVVKKVDRYILVPITITKKMDDKFLVSSGLSEGDEVVISGLNLLEREFFGGDR